MVAEPLARQPAGAEAVHLPRLAELAAGPGVAGLPALEVHGRLRMLRGQAYRVGGQGATPASGAAGPKPGPLPGDAFRSSGHEPSASAMRASATACPGPSCVIRLGVDPVRFPQEFLRRALAAPAASRHKRTCGREQCASRHWRPCAQVWSCPPDPVTRLVVRLAILRPWASPVRWPRRRRKTMHHNEFITADLAFRDYARGRSDEQDFYETYGEEPVVRTTLNHALAALRAAFQLLGQEARHPQLRSRTRTSH